MTKAASVKNIDIKRLSDCSLTDAVNIWNEGFKGYFVDVTLTTEGYLKRLQNEGLSQSHSLIAYCEGKPAGFLLSGIRYQGETKVAWNGGTGVSPEFRKSGVGKVLVQAALDVYKTEVVALATLEAISNNAPAISLYQKFGYEVVDRLIFLRHEGRLDSFVRNDDPKYFVRSVSPASVGELDFYHHSAPWQAQWQSLVLDNGEAVLVTDSAGTNVAYALFRNKFGQQKSLESIALYQCEVRPGRGDARSIAAAALEHIYSPLDEKRRRTTSNLRMSNELVLEILCDAGFTTFVEQVKMEKVIC
jgi:ribosomal protein S18 acetylase RimI-like enzyme